MSVINPAVLVKAETGYPVQPSRVPAFNTSIQAQKKRRMLGIVVSRLSVVFQRLMLLDYQIGLNFASGMESMCDDRITNRAHHPTRRIHLQG
jgi:hypothetical protein